MSKVTLFPLYFLHFLGNNRENIDEADLVEFLE